MAIADQLTQLNTKLGEIKSGVDSQADLVDSQADLIEEIRQAVNNLPEASTDGGLTVDDMSIGTAGAMPSGDLSLTVVDPDGNFAWKTYTPTNGLVLPENIVAGKMVLGVSGAGAGSGSSVTAGISLAHATGSGKDEQVAIYYMTPEGTQTVKLVTVPASAYATPVSTTFTTVMNAPISVQAVDSTRQLSCYLSDSEFMPIIGTDCGGTITYCVAKSGTANWPMLYVQPLNADAVKDTIDRYYPILAQGIEPENVFEFTDYEGATYTMYSTSTYDGTQIAGKTAVLDDYVQVSISSSSAECVITLTNDSDLKIILGVNVTGTYIDREGVTRQVFNFPVALSTGTGTDVSEQVNAGVTVYQEEEMLWEYSIAGAFFYE